MVPYEANSIAELIKVIESQELAFPLEKNRISEKTQSLLKRMLFKDYIRRIKWIELFSIKIDEEGNYLPESSIPPSMQYLPSSCSISVSEEKDREHRHSFKTTTKIDSAPPREHKKHFYS